MSCEWHELAEARPRLLLNVRKYVRTKADAEDLVGDTLVRAYLARETFTAGTNLVAWLCTIARHLWLSQQRKAWRLVVTDEPIELRAPDDPEASLHLEDTLFNMRAHLSDDQCEAVVLAARGLSYGEIGAAVGAVEGTVKSRVHRGREALRAAA